MLVKMVMLSADNLITISSNTTLKEAMDIMDKNKFLSIPVVDGELFKGSISKDQIYEAFFDSATHKEEFLQNNKVGDFIRTDIPIINAQENMESAAALLEKMSISFVAVVDDFNKFLGILTHKAVFKEFTNAFGLNKGDRIAIRAFDVPGQISKLARIITENHADIISLVIVDTKSLTDVKEIIVRIKNGELNDIKKKLKESGFKVM